MMKQAMLRLKNKLKHWTERYKHHCLVLFGHILSLYRKDQDEYDLPYPRKAVRNGFSVFFLLFIVLLLWSGLAPLNSAAVAPGTVVLSGEKKTIQHLEGGIVKDIFVEEGSEVGQGDLLVQLEETAAMSHLELISKQLWTIEARIARLIAERDHLEEIPFPKALTQTESEDLQDILKSERQLFSTRRTALEGQISVLEQKEKQLGKEIEGLESQTTSAQSQLGAIKEELAMVAPLVESGDVAKTRLLALNRQEAELIGNVGDYQARIARAQQAISQNTQEELNLLEENMEDIIDKLHQAQNERVGLLEQQMAAQDIVNRLNIIAPQAGIITGLQIHTKGGVISPGQTILNIIPQDDELIVEARVNPQDIDVVHPGLLARIQLTAYKTRNIPPVEGVVQTVSADRFIDESTGVPYFKARIRVEEESLAELIDVDLYPGMPADVLIVTGSRTALGYLLSPISEAMNKSFREQ